MRERRAEVRAVDGPVPRGLGRVDVLAAAAVEFDGLFVGDVAKPDGEQRLRLAEDAWAPAEVCFLVLL